MRLILSPAAPSKPAPGTAAPRAPQPPRTEPAPAPRSGSQRPKTNPRAPTRLFLCSVPAQGGSASRRASAAASRRASNTQPSSAAGLLCPVAPIWQIQAKEHPLVDQETHQRNAAHGRSRSRPSGSRSSLPSCCVRALPELIAGAGWLGFGFLSGVFVAWGVVAMLVFGDTKKQREELTKQNPHVLTEKHPTNVL